MPPAVPATESFFIDWSRKARELIYKRREAKQRPGSNRVKYGDRTKNCIPDIETV